MCGNSFQRRGPLKWRSAAMRRAGVLLSVAAMATSLPLEAAEVRLLGEWYDQDKANDAVSGRSWYYEYDPDDPIPAGETYPPWKYGLSLSKSLAADSDADGEIDDGEDWGDWGFDGDASCWAATASNMLRYMGGGDRYHDWVFESDWPDGSTYTWQTHGGADKALHAEGYATRILSSTANTAQWVDDPLQFASEALDAGLPVALAITDKSATFWGKSHLVTLWAIDEANGTLTISDSDRDEVGDFRTEAYDFHNDVWHVPGTVGYEFWINEVQTLATVAATTSGSWVTESIWDYGEVGGTHGDPLNPQLIRMLDFGESGGTVAVPALGGPYASLRTIVRGPRSTLHVIDDAELILGSLHVDRYGTQRTGKLELEGKLVAQRADTLNALVDVQGGQFVVEAPSTGQTIAPNWTVGGVTTLRVGDGGIARIAGEVRVEATKYGDGRLHAGSGSYETAGTLDIGGALRVHDGGTATFTGDAFAAHIGGGIQLDGGWIDVIRSQVAVDGTVHVGLVDSAAFDLRGADLTCNALSVGYAPGSANRVALLNHDGRSPALRARQFTFGYGDGETTVEQYGGFVGKRVSDLQHPDLILGQGAGSLANYYLHDGSLEIEDIMIGPHGTGRFTQLGGEVTIHSQLFFDGASGAWDNLYRLEAGTLNLRSSYHRSGAARFEYAGGELHMLGNQYGFDKLAIGDGHGPKVVMELNDATLQADEILVGTTASGGLQHTGGSLIANRLGIAQQETADHSHVALRDVDLEVAGTIYVGLAAKGDLFVYEGSSVVAEEMVVGSNDDSSLDSTVLHHNGTVFLTDSLILGDYAQGTGRYSLSGDLANTVDARAVLVGRQGQGEFSQTGGSHAVATSLVLGVEPGSLGKYWHNGGELDALFTQVGSAGAGSYDHRSGIHNVYQLDIGAGIGGSGVYRMAQSPSGGAAPELYARGVSLGAAEDSLAEFSMESGRVQVTNDLELGEQAGSVATLVVARPGTTFHIGRNARVGLLGAGELTARSSGVVSVDGLMTVGGVAPGTVRVGGGRGEGLGSVLISPATGTLRGYGGIFVPVENQGLIVVDGSMLTFWEPVTGGGRVEISASTSAEFKQGGVLEGRVDLQRNGTLSLDGGLLRVQGGIEGNGFVNVNGELRVESDVVARGVSVGQWGASRSRISQRGPEVVKTEEVYVGMTGEYELAGEGRLYGGDGAVNGIFRQEQGTAEFGALRVGGGDDYSFSPGHVAEYQISAGKLEISELLVGVPGIYNPFDPLPGRFSVLSASADISVTTGIEIGAVGELDLVRGARIRMTGSYWHNESEDPANLADLANLELVFEGGKNSLDPFEIASQDLGISGEGYVENFAVDILRLGGADVGEVQLVNKFVNQAVTGEALYVNRLVVGAGSTLDLNGYSLYYRSAEIASEATIVLNGGMLARVPEPSAACLAMIAVLFASGRSHWKSRTHAGNGRG